MTAAVIEKGTLRHVFPVNPFKIIMGIANWLDPAAVGRATIAPLSGVSRFTAPPGQRLMNDYFSLCSTMSCRRSEGNRNSHRRTDLRSKKQTRKEILPT